MLSVSGADKIQISLINGDTLDAEIIGSDPATDIALLKVEADELTDIVIGNSDNVEVVQGKGGTKKLD